jgi:hypothetical protein
MIEETASKGDPMIPCVMLYYLVVMKEGRADIVTVQPAENPNEIAEAHYVLDSYTVQAEAQECCDV